MKAFKELATEAKKKEMIRVKLKKGKKIGHVITSPGKGGKPGKVLKRKGMPGKKDIGEKWSSIKAIKVAFKRDWEKVKSGKVDIGDKKVEDFYAALFNHFADTGEMPLGTQKARTGDPYEWINDKLMDESVAIDDGIELFEELAYLLSKNGKQTFVVSKRNTKGMRGKQDKFSMSVIDTKTKKEIEDLGSHESLKGAIKYALNRGFVKEDFLEIDEGGMGGAPKASKGMELKSVKREYEKLMKKWGSTPITKIPFKEFSKIRELGDKLLGTPKGAGLGMKVGDLLKHMKELYAPGNMSRNRNPDFDERQAMFNSNYKRINKKNPSKDEMRAAGVGKGGDNPKGVKAWKAAMAALKASEGRRK